MTLDPNNIRAIVAIITLLVMLAGGVIGYFWRRSQVNNESFEKLRGRVGEAERRIGLVEQQQASSPQNEHVDDLRREIGTLKADVGQQLGKLQGEMVAIGRQLTMIHQALTKVH